MNPGFPKRRLFPGRAFRQVVTLLRVVCGSVPLLSAAASADVAWRALDPLPYNRANLDFPVRWDNARGVRLRISDGMAPWATVTLGRKSSTVTFAPDRSPGSPGTERISCRPFEKDLDGEPAILLFKRRSRGWSLYLDDVPLVEMPELFPGPLTLEIDEAVLPDRDAPKVFVQRVASYVFKDDFLVPEDTEYPLMQWEKRTGDWQLHSVTQQLSGTLGARGIPGRTPPAADRSPNFYSLSGRGTNAVIASGMDFLDRYRVGAAVQHNSGTNGLVFLLRPESGEFHALTLENPPDSDRETLVLALWRGRLDSPRRDILAAAELELFPGQWHWLQASLYDDQVVCSINRSEVLRERLALPPGGQFGLFANTSEGTRFDDVDVATHGDLPIVSKRDIARFLNFSPDQFRIEPGSIHAQSENDPLRRQEHHLSVLRGSPAHLSIGGPSSSPDSVEAVFRVGAPPTGPCAVSLGTNGFRSVRYSLSCLPENNGRRVRLLAGDQTVLDEFLVPTQSPDASLFSLRLEAREKGRLLGSLNGRLAVRAAITNLPAGPAGVSAFPGTRVSLPILAAPELEMRDHREDVQNFVIDPFMRHWASPEGQWVPFPDGLVWYRGDVFGAVEITLPLPDNAALHMGVPEGSTNGACILRTDDGHTLHVEVNPGVEEASSMIQADLPLADIPRRELEEVGELPVVTVHMRDHCLWIEAGNQTLFSTHLTVPLAGTRMRVRGYNTETLRFLRVVRDQVLDVLFKKSLFDWTINGGRWEIVNRFHCDPRWSHMNGENADGLAALWSHFEFSGDFCAELFAGTRHGWYQRIGDFNMTLLNATNFTGSGYTIITTGWDPDESALYTRLLRNGKELAKSTRYAAPRYREGNVRKGYEPLVASGRDAHGAWYSIKLRRIGDRLKYSFDNVPILEVRDPRPLPRGGFGIWTYRTSMMVARVRVAAEKITPRPVAARRIAPALLTRRRAPEPRPAIGQELPFRARPLQPKFWCPEDDVSHPRLHWIADSDNKGPTLWMRSRLGAGTFLAAADLPPLPTDILAGHRFEIARAPDTAVNFAFTLGNTNAAAFEPAAAYSFSISGTTSKKGPRRILESNGLPASPADGFPRGAAWTTFFAPLPNEAVSIAPLCRIDGFGNLQPDPVQQGLGVNPPGAAYAVREFAPVWHGAGNAARALRLADRERERLAEIDAGLAPGAIGAASVPLPEGATVRVYWQKPPRPEDLEIALSKTLPDTLVFSIPGENPWRMPPNPLFKVNDTALPLAPHGNGWKAEIPRPPPWRQGAALQARLFTNAVPVRRQMLLPVDAPTNFPPMLISLKFNGHFNAFETVPSGPAEAFKATATATIVRGPPPEGSFLRLENRGRRARLHGVLGRNLDLLANPILSFRYRADGLAKVSLEPVPRIAMHFSEPLVTSQIETDPALPDSRRHGYRARAVPVRGEYPLNVYQSLAAASPGLRSRHRIDQTGLYSWIEVGRLTCGPCIGPERPLEFQAFFSDLDAVQKCEYRIVADGKSAALPEIPWQVFTNETVVSPPTANFSPGPFALQLRAKDTRGAMSDTVSVPFLYDDVPPKLTVLLEDTPEASNGKQLALLAEKAADLSPLRFDNLSLRCEGEPVPFNPNSETVALTPGQARIVFDWPRLLAAFLDKSANGDVLEVELDGIADGARNAAAPAHTSLVIDYAADATPPTPTSARVRPGNNPRWLRLALGKHAATSFFSADRYTRYTHVSDFGDYGALEMTPIHPRSAPTLAFGKTPWIPSEHPWLALSLCATHAMVEADKAAVTVTLHAAKDQKFTVNGKPTDHIRLPLIAEPSEALKSRYAKSLIGKIDWTTNRWNDMLIDVRRLADPETGALPAIASVELGFAREKNLRVRIRSMAVMAPWEPETRLHFTAHDASGMGGIVWPGGETDRMEVAPATLPSSEDGLPWRRLRLRDKPGNTTPEIYLPVPPPEPPEALNETAP